LNCFEGIITNSTSGITETIDDVLNDLEASLVSGVTEELGIQQFYSLHLMAVCGGNLSSPTDSDAKFTIKSCTSYSKLFSGMHIRAFVTRAEDTTILSKHLETYLSAFRL